MGYSSSEYLVKLPQVSTSYPGLYYLAEKFAAEQQVFEPSPSILHQSSELGRENCMQYPSESVVAITYHSVDGVWKSIFLFFYIFTWWQSLRLSTRSINMFDFVLLNAVLITCTRSEIQSNCFAIRQWPRQPKKVGSERFVFFSVEL